MKILVVLCSLVFFQIGCNESLKDFNTDSSSTRFEQTENQVETQELSFVNGSDLKRKAGKCNTLSAIRAIRTLDIERLGAPEDKRNTLIAWSAAKVKHNPVRLFQSVSTANVACLTLMLDYLIENKYRNPKSLQKMKLKEVYDTFIIHAAQNLGLSIKYTKSREISELLRRLKWDRVGPIKAKNKTPSCSFNAGSKFEIGKTYPCGDGFTLEFLALGNLVLWGPSKELIWLSHFPYTSKNGPGHFATMQQDGNLVIYTINGEPVWSSRTVTTNPSTAKTKSSIISC